MSRKVPIECTEFDEKDKIHFMAIGTICQPNKLCSKETSGVDTTLESEILKNLQGTKVYSHPVERDDKGNVRRVVAKTKRAESGIEK